MFCIIQHYSLIHHPDSEYPILLNKNNKNKNECITIVHGTSKRGMYKYKIYRTLCENVLYGILKL